VANRVPNGRKGSPAVKPVLSPKHYSELPPRYRRLAQRFIEQLYRDTAEKPRRRKLKNGSRIHRGLARALLIGAVVLGVAGPGIAEHMPSFDDLGELIL
jgi:hypothetical protein